MDRSPRWNCSCSRSFFCWGVHNAKIIGVTVRAPWGETLPCMMGTSSSWPYGSSLRCKMRIQSGADKDQDGCGQEDDRIVATQTEGARAAGKHESAQGIDDVGQRI